MDRKKIALVAALAVAGTALTLSGCKEDGPATKAGKAADSAASKASTDGAKAADKAGDAAKDMTK